jgi:putative ABC transport system permease protein
MRDVLADFRVAARGLLRSKGFAAAGILTLALGIGATTTIFSVVYGVLLRPLPYRDADRLVVIQGEKAYSTGPRIMNFSAPEFEPFASAITAFSSVASSGTTSLAFRSESGVQSVYTATVSGAYFSTLGTQPLLGRVIGDESEPVVVISERLWQRLFARAPDIVGRSIALADGTNVERSYTIVGVMPAEFQLPFARMELWRTLAHARTTGDQRVRENFVGGHEFIARIKDGVTFENARADAMSVSDSVLKPRFTTSRIDMYAKVTPLNDHVRGTMGPMLWVLMGAVTLVLVVACANVANLILARQASRSREISVRLALGAPRGRLVAHLLAESAVIALAGAVAGILIAFGAVELLVWIEPAQFTRLDAIDVDLPVMAFASFSAVLSVMLAGLSPAIVSTRTDAVLAMRAGSRGTVGAGSVRWLRSALVVGEIATSIILIVGATLLTRSLVALLETDLGVNTENVLAVNLDMAPGPGRPVDEARRQQIASDLEERLSALPAVKSVGIGAGVPPTGEYMRVSFILSNGKSTDSHMVTSVPASPGYFSTLQVRLLAGRLFEDSDTLTSTPVVILNREAARRFFGTDDPLGRTLPVMSQQMTIVGVVDNVKYTGIASGPEGVIYRPFSQSSFRIAVLLLRTTGDPNAIAADVRRIINNYDSDIGIPRVRSLDGWIADATAQPRFRTLLLSSIAGIALVLAMIGLYGVIAYSTSQRTAEIGLRMAIGAQRSDVVRLVLAEGTRLAIAGIVLGVAGAYWATRLLSSFLYGVTATDLGAFAGSSIALLVVALLATYLPARRAARIDPMTALRSE